VTDLAAASAQLQRTRPWVRFLGLVGFVWSGLLIVGGLAGGAVMLAASRPEGIGLLFVYPLAGVLYIYPSLCLFRYADGIGRFLATGGVDALALALDAQRAFWKFAGLLTVVSLVVAVGATVLGVVLGVAFGLMAGQ
jgi:hypothetical protein